MKRCTKCGEEKPLEAFHVDRRSKDGKCARCKPCQLAATRASYVKHKEKKLAKAREYQRKHPEKRATARKKWENKHPEKRAEYKKRHHKRHPEKRKLYWTKYYAKNRKKLLAKAAEYREENRVAIYARRNRTKHEESLRKRRALKLNAYVAPVNGDEILKRDLGICGICSGPIMGKLELDHIIPLTRSGTHEPNNVQLAHPSCNRQKHGRLPSECKKIEPKNESPPRP